MLLAAAGVLLLGGARAAVPYQTVDWPGGEADPEAALGNPLVGMYTSPQWGYPYLDTVPSTLEYYYVPLNEIMNSSLDDFAGFDGYLEPLLNNTAGRAKHAVLRFYLDYPSKPTAVPAFLVEGGLAFNDYSDYGGGRSPDYTDPNLQAALTAFIAALGARYDGDRRIGFIQLGLLGFWGEWHTYPHSSWLPDAVKGLVVDAFAQAFNTTQLNARTPHASAVGLPRFGFHDDSFAYSTLDGKYNGNVSAAWFFWPSVEAAGASEFWRIASMGGELRPELQAEVFADGYPADSEYKQDVLECIEVTHATYLLNYAAFAGGGYTGAALARARDASSRMGYRFVVPSVAASGEGVGAKRVALTVELANQGVAPFYYPLGLALACGDGSRWVLPGAEAVQPGESRHFTFGAVPATATCLQQVTLSLVSDFIYPERPLRFAQGSGPSALQLALRVPPVLDGDWTVTVDDGGGRGGDAGDGGNGTDDGGANGTADGGADGAADDGGADDVGGGARGPTSMLSWAAPAGRWLAAALCWPALLLPLG